MSYITVKGYVNRPQVKAGNKGAFAVFSLGETQKNRDGQEQKNYFNVTDFNSQEAPEESSFVEVEGYLNFRKYQKDGAERVSYDINAKSVKAVSGISRSSRSSGSEAGKASPAKDPWEE